MHDKKNIIIVAIIILLFVLLIEIFFYLYPSWYKKMNLGNLSLDNGQSDVVTELKKQYPNLGSSQIDFYIKTAEQKSMTPCIGREDETICIYSVAFINKNHNFCGEIKNETERMKCSNAILSQVKPLEIDSCLLLKDDDVKTNCLINVFSLYKQSEDCLGVLISETRDMCRDSVFYKSALTKKIEKLCDNISTEVIKKQCHNYFK